jgi:hypothetical protein
MWARVSYRTMPATPPPAENRSTDTCTFELPSGDVLISKQSSVFWEAGVRFHLSAQGKEQLEKQGNDCKGHSSPASLGGGFSSISESTDRSFDGQDVENLPHFLSPSEIISWLDAVTYNNEKMPPLTCGSGVMRSVSVNNILMTKGLIDPVVYLDFMDLELLSHCCSPISQVGCFG